MYTEKRRRSSQSNYKTLSSDSMDNANTDRSNDSDFDSNTSSDGNVLIVRMLIKLKSGTNLILCIISRLTEEEEGNWYKRAFNKK